MKRINALIQFPAYLARKYLTSRGEPRFASLLTIVAILGVAVGIAALIVVISVMSGFGEDLERKLMGFNPHITVAYPGYGSRDVQKQIVQNFSGIEEMHPFVRGEVVIQTGRDETLGAMGAKILGLKEIPSRMSANADFFWPGGVKNETWWQPYFNPLERGVILGNEMIYQIGAHPDLGDTVMLIAPFGGVDPFGNPSPMRREYQVVGGFRSGFFEYDLKYVLMSLDEARRLLRGQGRYGLQIVLEDPRQTEFVVRDLQKFLGSDYDISGWTEKNQRLVAALKLEKMAMIFLLFLIIVISSFSVVGVTLMNFFSKRRDLAVLMAMGASPRMISRIFLFNGGWIGFAGAGLGALIGLGLCWIIARSNFMLPPSYYLDYLPVSVNPLMVFGVALGGVLISMMAAFYPAHRASRMKPVELLRYE